MADCEIHEKRTALTDKCTVACEGINFAKLKVEVVLILENKVSLFIFLLYPF